MADHWVDVSLNEVVVGGAQWNGTEPHLMELSGLPFRHSVQSNNRLTLSIPRRRTGEKGDVFIDVVMLNRIEIVLPPVGGLHHGYEWRDAA